MLGRRTLIAWAVATSLAITLALPATAVAMTVRQGDSVTVAQGELLSDDLYAFGNTITIDGIVDGDVVAFGQTVVISGDVRGSVITAAQTVRIDGEVDGTVRAAGSMVDVAGTVGGDALAGANRVTVGGEVIRDLAAGAQAVSVTGAVGRNVMVSSESLLIGGEVGGNVEAQSNRVVVASGASVLGNLDYTSASSADVQGSVSGTTLRHEPQTKTQEPSGPAGVARAIFVAGIVWIQSLIGVVLLGLLMVFVMRKPMQGASRAATNRPLPSLGAGSIVFFGGPMAVLFVFVVGLFMGAWWLAFVLIAVLWLLLLAGLIVGSLALGQAVLRKTSPASEPALVWSLLLGLVLVWLASAVPFLGALAGWAVMVVGTGALVLLWMGKSEKPVPAPAEVPMPVSTHISPPMA